MIHRLVWVGVAIGSLFYAFPTYAQEDDVVAGSSADPPAHLSPGEAFKGSSQYQAGAVNFKTPNGDPGEDDYGYALRLWEGKFFPEAQQRLKAFLDKYPQHNRTSYARNLLGRAYLDDGKPREAAPWFLLNYKVDTLGARAPDSLLFLAKTMQQLNDTKRACIALAEFASAYAADAAGRLKGQYDVTRATVKCD